MLTRLTAIITAGTLRRAGHIGVEVIGSEMST